MLVLLWNQVTHLVGIGGIDGRLHRDTGLIVDKAKCHEASEENGYWRKTALGTGLCIRRALCAVDMRHKRDVLRRTTHLKSAREICMISVDVN